MPATVQQTMFLARERPLASTTKTGEFALQLLVFDVIDNLRREPWRLLWTGPTAAKWWAQHQGQLKPGAPLNVHAHRIRAHQGARGAEIHAHLLNLDTAPAAHAPSHPAPSADPVFPPLGQPAY